MLFRRVSAAPPRTVRVRPCGALERRSDECQREISFLLLSVILAPNSKMKQSLMKIEPSNTYWARKKCFGQISSWLAKLFGLALIN